MEPDETPATYLLPPVDQAQFQFNDWFPVEEGDATCEYLTAQLWPHAGQPQGWQAARLSSAVFLFRATGAQETWLVKYYRVKVGEKPAAGAYARRELESTQRAGQAIQAGNLRRVPHVFGCTQATLFMEYVAGLTLEDFIAVRRSRPGALPAALQETGSLLADLHAGAAQAESPPAFEWALNDVRKYTRELFEHGVLEGNRLVYEAILRILERWEADPAMAEFPATYVHGDATTSNFVFQADDRLVAIDWERMHLADPALDLGRLMAEVGHSVGRHGGTAGEAGALIERLVSAYQQSLPADWDRAVLAYRAGFYRASSLLRIGRNGWIPRQQRLELITQAIALLAE